MKNTITASLSSETVKGAGVIKIGLHGLGGVGKTTLAKDLYNHLLEISDFDASCFLYNVREVYRRPDGLLLLQNKLISGLLNSETTNEVRNDAQGTNLMKSRFVKTKVLLIIDDVDHIEQWKSLMGPYADGSVVIITTRDTTILDKIQVKPSHQYEVSVMNDAESLKLFTAHAFSNDAKPSKDIVKLSNDVLRHAGKLPLALVVFGSHLLDESKQGWIEFTDQLQLYPIDGVEEKLVISYVALEKVHPKLQDIFLDVACFFVGWDKESAVKIMQTCYTSSNYYIQILKKKSLLSINNRNQLEMHGLLGKMGKQIARNKFPHDKPEKHTRLWALEDIRKVLLKQKGTEAIECIIQHDLIDLEYYESEEELFSADTSLSFTMETFTGMTNLRFLHLQGGTVSGNFVTTFGDLKWLRWDYCPLTYISSEFYPQNIVIFELLHSKITKWEQKMVFKKLKTIDMSSSVHLVSTPDFNMFPCLETLNLQGCESLKEFFIPVESLKSLVSLNLGGCSSLKQLPDNLGNLTSLKMLNAGQLNVSNVPASIGNLNKLVELSLNNNMKLKTLPDTICNLRALESLSIVGCSNLEELPTDLGDIKSLTNLNVGNNDKLGSLPDSICNLKALEFLRITSCTNLKEFPKELGNMESLKVLSAEWLSVTGLPDSVGSLQKLVKLYLSNNRKLARLPDKICKLRALEILKIDDCGSLKSLPMELGKIKSLKVISAELLKVEKLPNSIGHLNKLVELKLCGNFKLTTLPNTISNLSSLEILDLSSCEEVNILPNELWELPSLRELDAGGTTLLKKLPDIEPRQISTLPLMRMDLSCSGLTDLPWGFSYLSKLENLDLSGCDDLMSIPELPPNLKSISARGCRSLEYLFFTDCSCLIKIPGLEELTSLRELHLGGCNSSLLADTLTRRFFQLWSGFGHEIKIYTPSAYLPEWISQSPYWISGSSHEGSTLMLLELLPNEPHNFLGIILCFKHIGVDQSYQTTYSVKNTKSDFIWRNGFSNENNEAQMMIVPASIFSVRDGERLEVTANQEIHGIHLLYKTEI